MKQTLFLSLFMMTLAMRCRVSSAFQPLKATLTSRLGNDPTRVFQSSTKLFSSSPPEPSQKPKLSNDVPLYRCQGLFAVDKPLDWTSNDVVSYIRGILDRDAKNRGAKTERVGSRRNKSRVVKVGHGGTLDPLAYGVLVVGVGSGTKQLQQYLTGSKRYSTTVELGYETTTLDTEGNITKTAAFDHVTVDAIKESLSDFRGDIMQIPPIFSAIRKDGKKLYQSAREGLTADDIKIDARKVHIYQIELLDEENVELPKFDLNIECGGGTYVRSLARDIGYKLDTVATTVRLQRTKQGIFTTEDCIEKPDWSADNIFAAIERCTEMLSKAEETADSPSQ